MPFSNLIFYFEQKNDRIKTRNSRKKNIDYTLVSNIIIITVKFNEPRLRSNLELVLCNAKKKTCSMILEEKIKNKLDLLVGN